jgi:NADPH-dependent ferric siderophore reductase
MTTNLLKVQKMQHPIKMRMLNVKRITELSLSMRRITLTGDDLAGFLTSSFDDHVKLILPQVFGAKSNMPVAGQAGLVFAEATPKPVMRDYTPRRYDPATNKLDVDFVLHH